MPALLLALALSAPAEPPVVTEAELDRREDEWRTVLEVRAGDLTGDIALLNILLGVFQSRLAAGEGSAQANANRIGDMLEDRAEYRRLLHDTRAELVNGHPYFNLSRAGHAVAQGAKGAL